MMMKNYDESIEINHNQRCPYIPNHSYRVLIIGGSGSGKTDALLKLININNQILTKLIYALKNHPNQNINCLLTEEKK